MLPHNLIYQNSNTTHGDYNYNTGIWNIDSLPSGDSAILRVTMWGSSRPITAGAELMASTPIDINPTNNKAYITL